LRPPFRRRIDPHQSRVGTALTDFVAPVCGLLGTLR
jgi:hypothetical protein